MAKSCLCVFGVIPYGGEKRIKHFPENPGTMPRFLLFMCFSVRLFFLLPINSGIALHSLYRGNVSAEIFLLYVALTATLKLQLFFVYTTLHLRIRKQINQYTTVTLKLFS